MKYHEPFPQIEGNSNFSGTHEMMPFRCLKMMYDVLCSIDDSLDKIAGGGVDLSFGEKLKALKIEKEEKPANSEDISAYLGKIETDKIRKNFYSEFYIFVNTILFEDFLSNQDNREGALNKILMAYRESVTEKVAEENRVVNNSSDGGLFSAIFNFKEKREEYMSVFSDFIKEIEERHGSKGE
jgi:hypothetical protein